MSIEYSIRNYRPEDFKEYVRLLALAEEPEPAGRGVSPEDVALSLERPGYSPERELFVAEIGGRLAGYLDITMEFAIGRAILRCWVVPEYRHRGLAISLVERATGRVRESGARVVQMNVPDDSEGGKRLALRMGFETVRRFLRLRINLAEWSQHVDLGGVDLVDLERVGLDGLVGIQNRAFYNSWGFCPNTVTEIAHTVRTNRNSPEDIILACEGAQVTGYCWTKPDDGSGKLPEMGQVHMLGVDPGYRGTGLGRKLMLAGLAHLKSKGLGAAWLEVDGENVAALRLYRALGFRQYAGSLWYEKPVSQ